VFTNCQAILNQIQSDLQAAIPAIPVFIDEPLNLVYADLPNIALYPVREDFVYDESFQSEDKKRLIIRVELRMAGGPASSLCSPIINTIAAAIRADRTLAGMAMYVELQGVEWANDTVSQGKVCGASLDIQVDNLVS